MFYATLLLATSALVGLASAQNTTVFPVGGPYKIDPNEVPIENRTAWCNAQHGACPLICGGAAFPNNCSATTLQFTCTCTDGSSPNISSFTNMIPAYECIQWVKDCVAAAGSDLNKLTDCRSVVCGNRDPGNVPQKGNGGGSSSSSAAPSGSGTPTSGGGNGGSQTTNTAGAQSSTGAAVALNVAREYGTPILAAGMLGLFGLAL